jgi:hypothetical protein
LCSPDKYATRAIEEASAYQSAEFVLQRAAEIQVYLNQLIQHPVCFQSMAVRLFLALQDDLDTAWPECSNNALTRLTQASVGAAVKVSEHTSTTKLPWQGDLAMHEYGEYNAELLAVQSSEAVPAPSWRRYPSWKVPGPTTSDRPYKSQSAGP